MNDWMSVPWEAASKQARGGMIWPPEKTSILKRPALISSTIRASCWAEPWSTSFAGLHVLDIRHWIFGWAMTLGASTTGAAPIAANVPPAFTMNQRRPIVTRLSSSRHELVIGALGDM